jgi:very-long-chain enoyl-CoA reductase
MLGNFYSHVILMNLRPAGTTKRAIPKGFLFDLVSCPNYFLEIVEWIVFAIITQTVTGYLFAIVSAGQMWIWAVDKHRRYKKEFDGTNGTEKYPRRKILIPYVL